MGDRSGDILAWSRAVLRQVSANLSLRLRNSASVSIAAGCWEGESIVGDTELSCGRRSDAAPPAAVAD